LQNLPFQHHQDQRPLLDTPQPVIFPPILKMYLLMINLTVFLTSLCGSSKQIFPYQDSVCTGSPSYPYFCIVLKIFVLFYVLFVLCHSVYCLCVNVYCTVQLPPGGNPIPVNKYIISYIIWPAHHHLIFLCQNISLCTLL
jgi:hypothetical protein